MAITAGSDVAPTEAYALLTSAADDLPPAMPDVRAEMTEGKEDLIVHLKLE